jgi:hypothetical protein
LAYIALANCGAFAGEMAEATQRSTGEVTRNTGRTATIREFNKLKEKV